MTYFTLTFGAFACASAVAAAAPSAGVVAAVAAVDSKAA